MRIPRVHTEQPLAVGDVTLSAASAHYLNNVLRLKAGRELELFNGDGNNYRAHIVNADKRSVTARIESTHPNPCDEGALPVHLGICISRGERMDWVMQKSTELGVTEITPLFSERVEVKLDQKRLDKKLAHWREVIHHACAQSGRSSVPALHKPRTLDEWQPRGDLKWVLAPGQTAVESDQAPRSVDLMVGPEGGLSNEEIASAATQGFVAVSLGPRILRTETAPVVALSVLQSRWGDLRIT